MKEENDVRGNELLKEYKKTNNILEESVQTVSKVKFMLLKNKHEGWEESKSQAWDYHFETLLENEDSDFALYYKTSPTTGGWLNSEYFVIYK